MIICPNCQTPQLEGSIFCSECGATVIASHAQQVAMQRPLAGSVAAPNPGAEHLPVAPAAPLAFVVSNSGRRIEVHNTDAPVLIGRRDDARGIYPGVDLGAEGGYEAGVSRKHATIVFRQDTCYVEDLGSANGTFINGRQIAPQTPVPVAHGDELRCGMLVLRIELQ